MVDIFFSLSFETQVFLVTIAIFTLIFHVTYGPATVEKAPAFLTTLGIFGTFVGIAIGLLEFNTMNISESVPKLIDGIKTAVWASAAGIFAALTLKLRDIEGFRKRRPKESKASVEELIEALRAVEKALTAHIQPPPPVPTAPPPPRPAPVVHEEYKPIENDRF